MPEPEPVLAGELGPVGTDQLPARQRGEPGRDLESPRGERLDGAAMEDLSFDGAALEYRALRRVELVEAGGEERAERRRDVDVLASRRPSRASP